MVITSLARSEEGGLINGTWILHLRELPPENKTSTFNEEAQEVRKMCEIVQKARLELHFWYWMGLQVGGRGARFFPDPEIIQIPNEVV